MNYQDEIIKIVRTITQEPVLRFFYSFIRTVTADPDNEDVVKYIVQLFSAE